MKSGKENLARVKFLTFSRSECKLLLQCGFSFVSEIAFRYIVPGRIYGLVGIRREGNVFLHFHQPKDGRCEAGLT